jgi:hypothetical protein
MLFGGKKRTCGFGYNVCPVCFKSFDTKCQNIGGISQQPLLCSCIPLLVDDCLRAGYMPVLRDKNDEHCYFLRPIFGCKDNDLLSDDVDVISDCDFEVRLIFGCEDNESLSDDCLESSDCNSEAIHSKSDGTECPSSIASSTGAVLVGGNGNSTRCSGSDDDELVEDNLDNE